MRSTLDKIKRPTPPIGARIRFAYREHRELPWYWLEGVVTRTSIDFIIVGHYYLSHNEPWYLA